MSDEVTGYDLEARIAVLKSLAQKQFGDGLRMVRLIGPDLNPEYNDQISVARCQTVEQLVCESNRGSKCLGGEQLIYDPVRREHRRVDSVNGPFHVESKNPVSGDIEVRPAGIPFIKAYGRLYEFQFSNGETLVATPAHRVLGKDGRWIAIGHAAVRGIALAHEDQRHSSVGKRASTSDCGRFAQPRRTNSQISTVGRVLRQGATAHVSLAALCSSGLARQLPGALREPGLHRSQIALQSRETTSFRTSRESRRSEAPLASQHECAHGLRGTYCVSCHAGCETGVRRCSETTPDSTGRCSTYCRPCGEQPPSATGGDRSFAPSPVGVATRIPVGWSRGDRGHAARYTRSCDAEFLHASRGDAHHGMDQFGGSECRDASAPCELDSTYSQADQQSASSSVLHQRISAEAILDQSASEYFEASHPPVFNVGRATVLRIISCRFLREGAIWDFSVPPYANYVAAGLVHANTFTAACKTAAIARGVPLTTWDGKKIDCRFPHHKGKPLVIWVIGHSWTHIGETMFRLLFEDGQFQAIIDPKTFALRAYRPWEKWDAENAHKRVDGPPLIPPHEIDQKSWVWENKGAHQVARVTLRNGTRFHFYASTGVVKKGDPVHWLWIDESIEHSEYYPEYIARLTDYEGGLLWSTMIYRNVPALNNRMEAAMRQQEEVERGDREPDKVITSLFRFKQGGNPFLSMGRIGVNREIIGDFGEDEVKQRIDGGNIFDSTLIYPFFDKKLHSAFPDGTPPVGVDKAWDNLARVLFACQGLPPADWTHEMIIDPGAQKPAILFCAVPPDEWTDPQGKVWRLWGAHNKPFYVPYDEIYGKRYSWQGKDSVADIIKQKMRGIRFRRFIIDIHGARQTGLAGGKKYKDIFSDELERRGIESDETGFGFVAGDDRFPVRSRIVDGWMQAMHSGKPQLRIVTKRCPNLCWQLAHNQRKMVGDQVLEEENTRERNDLRQCIEYWASRNPKYVDIDQVHIRSSEPRKRSRLKQLFNQASDESSKRCHFGPGMAPTGASA